MSAVRSETGQVPQVRVATCHWMVAQASPEWTSCRGAGDLRRRQAAMRGALHTQWARPSMETSSNSRRRKGGGGATFACDCWFSRV